MSLIFINTDNSNPKDKIYVASASKSPIKAEARMQKGVRAAVKDSSGFTTEKTEDARGYTIRLKFVKATVADQKTKCELSGELIRYPESGPKMKPGDGTSVGFNFTGKGAVGGTDEGALLDCIEGVAKDMVLKAVPGMKSDMANR
jgi:hypothetical protein